LAKTPPGGKANPKAPNSAPKFGKQQTPVNGKKNKGDLLAGAGKKTPQSAPQVKRKKLAEEIDEEISDEDFEVSNCIDCYLAVHFFFVLLYA
jgi:hypothetical protein